MIALGAPQAAVLLLFSSAGQEVSAAIIGGCFILANTLITHLLVGRDRRWTRRQTRRRERQEKSDDEH